MILLLLILFLCVYVTPWYKKGPPGRRFGVLAAVGVLWCLISLLLLPSVIGLIGLGIGAGFFILGARRYKEETNAPQQ